MNKFKILIALLFTVLTGIQSVSADETEGGGQEGSGGNVILFEGQSRPFLLDRLMLNPALADSIGPQGTIHQPSIPLKHQPEMGSLLDSDRAAFAIAHERLNRWMKELESPRQGPSWYLLNLIRHSIHTMSYIRTTYRFQTAQRYFLPAHLAPRPSRIQTAILFLEGYGAFISSPVWDQLDIETQAGLIVHEGLRHIQFQYRYNDMTDAQMQLITAMIMDEKPSPGKTLEDGMSPRLREICLYETSVINPLRDSPLLRDERIPLVMSSEEKVFQTQMDFEQNMRSTRVLIDRNYQILPKLLKERILVK